MKTIFKAGNLPKFRLSLFREGFRQLRAGGIASAVIITLFCIRDFAGRIGYGGVADIQRTYCIVWPLSEYYGGTQWVTFIIASLFAVYAAFYLTTFLRSAKARDFYFATPHSGGTVWLSMAVSALAWIAISVAAFLLTSCLFLMPLDPRIIGENLFISCCVLSGLFMVFSMATLAVSMTGRLLNGIVNLLGLSFVSTGIAMIFEQGRDNPIGWLNFVPGTSALSEYDPIHFIYRRGFLSYSFYGMNEYDPFFGIFSSWTTIGYCLLSGLIMLAVAAVFITLRTGDSVGRPFTCKAAHVLSLTAVSLPIGLLAVTVFWEYLIRTGYADLSFDFSDVISCAILAVLSVVGFWGLEVLLTFEPKRAHKAFRYFPVIIALPLAVLLLGYFGLMADFNTVPDADEVESFTLVRNDMLPGNLAAFRMRNTLGRCVTEDTDFTDRGVIEYVTGQIKEVSDTYGHDMRKAYDVNTTRYDEYCFYPIGNLKGDPDSMSLITLRLNLKNGRTLTRTIPFDEEHVKALEKAIVFDSDYVSEFTTLPDPDRVNILINSIQGLTADEATAIYECFRSEYGSLPEKLKYIIWSSLNRDLGTFGDDETVCQDDLVPEEALYNSAVSASDTLLVSKSLNNGDYAIIDCQYGNNAQEAFHIVISGYQEGHLYDYRRRFDQTFDISRELFPRTTALIVSTCNAKFEDIPELIRSSGETADYKYADFNAEYHSGYDVTYIDYLYLAGKDYEKRRVNEWLERIGGTNTIAVDSSEMVQRLFEDIRATKTVDFTKPYCKVTWYNWTQKGKQELTFFAQTDYPQADGADITTD